MLPLRQQGSGVYSGVEASVSYARSGDPVHYPDVSSELPIRNLCNAAKRPIILTNAALVADFGGRGGAGIGQRRMTNGSSATTACEPAD